MNPLRGRRPLPVVAAVVTNALPLIGVIGLGWSLAAVVLLYWCELGVVLWWAVVRATVAQRPSNQPADALVIGATKYKRGGLSVPRTDLTVRVQHLPVVAVLVPVLMVAWLIVGAVAVGTLDQTAVAGALDRRATYATVGLGAVGVFASRGASTVSEYVLGGAYEEVSAQQALRSAVWPMVALGVAMGAAGAMADAGSSGLPLLVAVVCTKFLLDLADAYRVGARLRAFDDRTELDFGFAADAPDLKPVDGSPSEPVRTVRPRPLGVLASGAARGFENVRVALLVAVLLVATAGFGATGATRAAGSFGVVTGLLVGVLVAAGLLDHGVRYLSMEYRAGDDVVGYDRLLGAAQWRVAGRKIARATPERTVVDRLLGTETLAVEDGERTVRLPHLPDASVVQRGTSATERDASTVEHDAAK